MKPERVTPSELGAMMVDPNWLAERGFFGPGAINVIHIYHDDPCPCEGNDYSLDACTCDYVTFQLEPIIVDPASVDASGPEGGWTEENLRKLEAVIGTHKRVVRLFTGDAYKVPVRDIVRTGIKEEELDKYPRWDED